MHRLGGTSWELCWVEKANLQRLHSRWSIYITELEFRTGQQIREPEPEVEKGVASCNTAKWRPWDGTTLPGNDRQDLQVINWTELNTHTQGLQAVEHKHFNGLKWDFFLRDYLQFKAHLLMCPTHDPFRRHKIMKDITRSYVNISSKDQEKFKVFSQGNQRDNWYERADRSQRNLGRRTRVKDKAMSRWERKSKQLKQILWGGRPRTKAGFGII